MLTKNFHINEFACKDANKTPVPDKYTPNVMELAKNLQVLRDELGVPITINSGYRTHAHNKSVGGAPNSTHKKALAADIRAKGYTPAQVYAKVEDLIKAGKMKQGGLHAYDGFCHYDVRGFKARW